MKFLKLPILCLLLLTSLKAIAQQTADCPENIDLEQGDFTKWECATAINTGTGNYNWITVAAVSGRHTIVSGAGTDPQGNFPVVAPGGGRYSIKLGNNSSGGQMDRVRYTLRLPANANNFNLIYRYAVVFQDAGHTPGEQPFFRVMVTDSATEQPLPCNNSTFISTSNLPGFIETAPGSRIWYKDWSAATLRIGGMGGRTLYVQFISADCSLGGHYGYGYVDLNCGGYAITSANCNGAPNTPLTGPPGFRQYDWYDSSYTSMGTGQTIYIPSPAPSSYYNLVVTPYPGFGCIDTLATRIAYSTLAVDASPDTSYLCGPSGSAQLNVTATGSAPPFTYSWTPVATLSCITCTNPVATPVVNTPYVVAVTDSVGCTITDIAMVNAGVSITLAQQNITCNGAHDGAVTATPSGGKPPYTYSWNTTPVQSTSTITGLGPGVYKITITDANNCAATATATVIQPSVLNVTGTSSDVFCYGGNNGSASVTVSGGVAPYTYSWNTTPVQHGAGVLNLLAGTYSCMVKDANGCTATFTGAIAQPSQVMVTTTALQRPCAGLSTGIIAAHATGGTGPYTYFWQNGIFRNGDTIRNLQGGSYPILVTDSKGCSGLDTVVLEVHLLPLVTAGANRDICIGDSTTLTANGANTYNWQPADYLSCITCVRPVATPDTTITYYLTGTDGNGCMNKDTVTVGVIRRTIAGVDSTRHICPNEKVMLGAYGGASYEWSPVATLTGAFSSNPVAAPDSTITYRVIITENRCFKDTFTQQIIVLPKPSVHLGEDFFGIPGATVTLETQVTNAESIAWYPPAGLSCDDCYQPVASLDTNITYLAEVTNSYGCKAYDTINIRVSCDGSAIYMANTFTPNNDGQNDYFYPQGLGINSVKRFMIYDRWGEIVFSAANVPANVPERGWNGIFRNKELPPDVFLYVVETICKDGNPIVLKGDVTLVR